MATNNLKLIRKPELLAKLSYSKSTLFNRIKDGLITPPVAISGRAKAWPEHEVNEIIKAIVAGYDNYQIRELVINLMKSRQIKI